jgi:hypothetical protein
VDSQLGCAIPDGANFSPPGCLSPSNHWAVPQTWLKKDAWLSISKQPGMMIQIDDFSNETMNPFFFQPVQSDGGTTVALGPFL